MSISKFVSQRELIQMADSPGRCDRYHDENQTATWDDWSELDISFRVDHAQSQDIVDCGVSSSVEGVSNDLTFSKATFDDYWDQYYHLPAIVPEPIRSRPDLSGNWEHGPPQPLHEVRANNITYPHALTLPQTAKVDPPLVQSNHAGRHEATDTATMSSVEMPAGDWTTFPLHSVSSFTDSTIDQSRKARDAAATVYSCRFCSRQFSRLCDRRLVIDLCPNSPAGES